MKNAHFAENRITPRPLGHVWWPQWWVLKGIVKGHRATNCSTLRYCSNALLPVKILYRAMKITTLSQCCKCTSHTINLIIRLQISLYLSMSLSATSFLKRGCSEMQKNYLRNNKTTDRVLAIKKRLCQSIYWTIGPIGYLHRYACNTCRNSLKYTCPMKFLCV